MKFIRNFFIFFVVISFTYNIYGSTKPVIDDSLHIEIILSKQMLSEINFNANFVNSFSVTSTKHILLASINQFYLLGWGGIDTIGKKLSDTISCFAFESDGSIDIISNNELCYIDSIGKLIKAYKLPNYDMGISPGANVMYVYDRKNDLEEYSVYTLSNIGKVEKLFISPAPVMSVMEIYQSLLFAAGNALFVFDLENKTVKTIATVPAEQNIISIAADTLSRNIYFSTPNSVCKIEGTQWGTITSDFGGLINFFNNGLLVFDPEKKILIRITSEKK